MQAPCCDLLPAQVGSVSPGRGISTVFPRAVASYLPRHNPALCWSSVPTSASAHEHAAGVLRTRYTNVAPGGGGLSRLDELINASPP
ncbi:unnamed protein product [Boreogadus saida]